MSFRRWVLSLVLMALIAGFGLLGAFPLGPILSLYEDSRLFLHDTHRAFAQRMGWPLPGTPDLGKVGERLTAKGLKLGAPIFIRIFKRDSELELWMKKGDRFTLFQTYPICYWSGRLGPKIAQGDAQSPEGFYTVSRSQLNPHSQYYRAFDLGFPNALDRQLGRSGAYLMVHGNCVSAGCYAMTDPVIGELWTIATAALDGGQARFSVQVFPFRPAQWRLDLYRDSQWSRFWRDLKPAYDAFEENHVPPQIFVCGGRYAVQPGQPGSQGDAPLRKSCPAEASVSG
jgi:murein L,D-transpeptidase YafK